MAFRFVILVLSAVLIAEMSFGQRLEFTFRGSWEIEIPSETRPIYSLYDGKLYFTGSRVAVQSVDAGLQIEPIKVIVFDPSSMVTRVTFLSIPQTMDTRYSLSDIAFDGNRYALLSDQIYIFDSAGSFVRTLPSFNADKIAFLQPRKLLVYKNYNSHPLDDSVKTKLIIVDVHSGEVDFKSYPRFKYIGFTHLLGGYLATSENKVAFAQTIPYNVDFYDFKLNNIGSISDTLPNTETNTQFLDSIHNTTRKSIGVKDLLLALRSRDSFYRIEKILFLANDTLLVAKTFPFAKFSKRKLDVWYRDKVGGDWKILIRDQEYSIERPKDETIVTNQNIPLYIPSSSEIIFANGSNIFTSVKTIPPKVGIAGNKQQEYQDSYYNSHDLNNVVWHYQWRIVTD